MVECGQRLRVHATRPGAGSFRMPPGPVFDGKRPAAIRQAPRSPGKAGGFRLLTKALFLRRCKNIKSYGTV